MGQDIGGFVDSWPKTLVPSASNRSTPQWTLVDSGQGRSDETDAALGAKLPDDLGDDLLGCAADLDHDRPLVGRRLLERGELAVEQADRHEVLVARGHALVDQLLRAPEIDQPHLRPV